MPPPASSDSFELKPDLVDALRRSLAGDAGRMVRAGFFSVEEMLELLQDQAVYEGWEGEQEDLRKLLQGVVVSAQEEQLLTQEGWPAVTGYDKLQAAFSALERQGLCIRQNFSCCGNCGASEILGEASQERSSGKTVTGYAFFHGQDTDDVVEAGSLYLSYGTVMASPMDALAVGQLVAQELRVAGLKVHWDGTLQRRIGVEVSWQRRLSAH